MKIGFLEYAPGCKSMGRLIAFILAVAGVHVVAVGLTLIVWSFVIKDLSAIGSMVGLITLGLAIEGISGIVKNWAKAVEAKATQQNIEPRREA